MLVPGATLAGLTVFALLAAMRAASGLLREWSLAIATLLVLAGFWLGALAVAHVAVGIAARRSGTSR